MDSILKKFKDDGLTVDGAKSMTKEDFGMSPMSAKEAKIFGIQKDDSGDFMNARIFLFEKEKDLTKTKDYYDDLGKESAMAFSYTAANTKKLVLMQFNGDLAQDLVQKYADSADLKLTHSNFGTTTDSSQSDSISSASSSSNTAKEESYEEMKQRTLKSTPTDRVNWSNKEWEAFGMALSENGLAMDDNGYIITQTQKDQIEAERQNSEQNSANQSTSAQQDADSLSLTDFVNKYGMSPAAWKVQNGMSEEEALRSTQNLTSGEMQLAFSKYGIQK